MQVKLLIMPNISQDCRLWKAGMGIYHVCDTFLLNMTALGNKIPEYHHDYKNMQEHNCSHSLKKDKGTESFQKKSIEKIQL